MILPFSSRFWVIYIRLQDSNIFLLMPVQDMRLKSDSGDAIDGPAAAKLSPPGVSGGLLSGPLPAAIHSCLLPSAPCLAIRSLPASIPSQAFSYRLSQAPFKLRGSCSTGSSAFTTAGRGFHSTCSDIFLQPGLTPGKSADHLRSAGQSLYHQRGSPRQKDGAENIRLIHPFCQLGLVQPSKEFHRVRGLVRQLLNGFILQLVSISPDQPYLYFHRSRGLSMPCPCCSPSFLCSCSRYVRLRSRLMTPFFSDSFPVNQPRPHSPFEPAYSGKWNHQIRFQSLPAALPARRISG